MKVYMVRDAMYNFGCYNSYEEAKKLADIHNLSNRYNLCFVEEFEVKNKFDKPEMYFVKVAVDIPFTIPFTLDELNDQMMYEIFIYPSLDVKTDLEDMKLYEKDTFKTILHTSRASVYFKFKIHYLENESSDDLYDRAKRDFLARFENYKKRKEFKGILELSQMYSDLKKKVSMVEATIDNYHK